MPFEVVSALLCDDVRKEDSGKFLIIGAYTGEFIAPVLPMQFSPNYFIVGKNFDGQKVDIELSLWLDDEEIAQTRGTLSGKESRMTAFPCFFPVLQLENEVVLTLKARRTDGSDWSVVSSIPVQIASKIQKS